MTRILLLYGTAEGHTEDVVKVLCGSVGDGLAERGRADSSVDCRAIENAPNGIEPYDGVIVGSSIHMGQHHKDVVGWATDHHAALASAPSAFFQVSLSSAQGSDPERQNEATAYVDGFVQKTGWHPDLVGLFGGALLYTRYGFAKRKMLKAIAKKGGLGTDTHRDYDYTDYEAVRHFGEDVVDLVVHG
ncbi:MAG: flavodoxin domain-containing protein [Actinomycetes bacterium]